jgi:hypothetical protein
MPIYKINDHPRRSRTVWSVAEKIINYQLSIINYQLTNHSTYSTTYPLILSNLVERLKK